MGAAIKTGADIDWNERVNQSILKTESGDGACCDSITLEVLDDNPINEEVEHEGKGNLISVLDGRRGVLSGSEGNKMDAIRGFS